MSQLDLLVAEPHELHERHVLIRHRDEDDLDHRLVGTAPVAAGQLLVLATPGAHTVPSLVDTVPDLVSGFLTGIESVWVGIGGLAGSAPAVARLATRLGVEVVAPDGGVAAMPGAALYAGRGAGGTGWYRFAEDGSSSFAGARFPWPSWESWVPAEPFDVSGVAVTPAPCGLLVSGSVEDAFHVPVNQRFPKVVLGGPAPSPSVVAELLAALPDEPVMIVPVAPAAADHVWHAELAMRLSRDVVFSTGAQVRTRAGAVATVVPGPRFRPFPLALRQSRRGGDQQVLDVAAPPKGWERAGRRAYRPVDGADVVAEVVPSGLVVRAADDSPLDPLAQAAPFDPTGWTLALGTVGRPVGLPVLLAAERLLEALPARQRAAARVRMFGEPDEEAKRSLDRFARPLPSDVPAAPLMGEVPVGSRIPAAAALSGSAVPNDVPAAPLVGGVPVQSQVPATAAPPVAAPSEQAEPSRKPFVRPRSAGAGDAPAAPLMGKVPVGRRVPEAAALPVAEPDEQARWSVDRHAQSRSTGAGDAPAAPLMGKVPVRPQVREAAAQPVVAAPDEQAKLSHDRFAQPRAAFPGGAPSAPSVGGAQVGSQVPEVVAPPVVVPGERAGLSVDGFAPSGSTGSGVVPAAPSVGEVPMGSQVPEAAAPPVGAQGGLSIDRFAQPRPAVRGDAPTAPPVRGVQVGSPVSEAPARSVVAAPDEQARLSCGRIAEPRSAGPADATSAMPPMDSGPVGHKAPEAAAPPVARTSGERGGRSVDLPAGDVPVAGTSGEPVAPPVLPAGMPPIMTTSGAPVSTVSGAPKRSLPPAPTDRGTAAAATPERAAPHQPPPPDGPVPSPHAGPDSLVSGDSEPVREPTQPVTRAPSLAVPLRDSTSGEQTRFTAAAGEYFAEALATVNAAMATWPSMRVDESPGVKADYVAVCLFLGRGDGDAGAVNAAVRVGQDGPLDGQIPCLMSGIRRLPTQRRAVLRQGKLPDSLEHQSTPGTILTEPGFLAASIDLDVTVPGADLDVLIWPSSARRTSELMLGRPVDEAVFLAGARFKALAVRTAEENEEEDDDAPAAPRIAMLYRELAPGENPATSELDERDLAVLAKLDSVLARRHRGALRLVEDPEVINRLTTSMVAWQQEAAAAVAS